MMLIQIRLSAALTQTSPLKLTILVTTISLAVGGKQLAAAGEQRFRSRGFGKGLPLSGWQVDFVFKS